MPPVLHNENLRELVTGCLVDGIVAWPFGDEPDSEEAFLALTEEMEVQPMLLSALLKDGESNWPEGVVNSLRRTDMARFAAFELRMKEIRRVGAALASLGITGIWLKGIPFSYTLYEAPHYRPSSDADILIASETLSAVARLMGELGYSETPDMLFGTISQQKQFCRYGQHGLEHIFEFHLQTNNRPSLALFGFDELLKRSKRIDAQGSPLQIPSLADSFLMAVVHLLGHLPQDRRFLWDYDLKLMADAMAADDWASVKESATRYRVRRLVCAVIHSLIEWSPRSIPKDILDWTVDAARGRNERSAYYLRRDRNRRRDLWVGIQTLPTWAQRCRCMGQLVCPRPDYLRAIAGEHASKSLFKLYVRHWGKRLGRR